MKKVYNILLFAFIMVGMIACGADTSTPEAAVKGFTKAMGAGDFDKAADFATEDTKELLKMLNGLKNMGGGELPDMGGDVKIDKVECEIDGDEGTCTVCCDEDGNPEDPVKVKKVDGKWLVHISKEDANKEDTGDDIMEDDLLDDDMMDEGDDEMVDDETSEEDM